MAEEKPQLIINSKRLDGRGFEDLRPIKIESNPIANADGSAYIEWGNNKILAAVYGPREALPKHTQDSEKAVVKCRYAMSQFSSLNEHGRSRINRRSTEISKITKEVFENAVLLEDFPGSEINIFIEVLQSDGGTRAAGITAAAVALVNAGIPMIDIPYAVSIGKTGDTLITDVNYIEDSTSDADMPIAIMPKTGEILLLQMDGCFTKEELKRAVEMAKRAGKVISKLQKEALIAPYQKTLDKYRKEV
jgi:exosome complex component RRP41